MISRLSPCFAARLFVAATVLLAALVAAPADIAPFLQQGKELEAQKKFAEAAAAYTRALDLSPNDVNALARRAWVRHLTGDKAGALADYATALALAPDYDGARFQRYQVLIASKDYEAALADLTELARRTPDNPRNQYELARTFQRVGRIPEALRAADEMIRLAPTNVNSWAVRSFVREKSGDPAGALADTEKALALATDAKTVAMYAKDRDRLKPLVAAAISAPAPAGVSAAALPNSRAPTAAAPASSSAAPAYVRLDLRGLSAAQYNGAASVAMEGLRTVFAPMSDADTAKFEKQWAPLFNKPSAEAVAYLNTLIPLVQEFLSLRSVLGEAAAAYDKAIEEARFAAGYGSDAGLATALAEAGRAKAALEEGRNRLTTLAAQIATLGNPPDAAVAQRKRKARHNEAIKTVKRAAGLPEEKIYLKVDFSRQPEGWLHELITVGSEDWHPTLPIALLPAAERYAYLIPNDARIAKMRELYPDFDPRKYQYTDSYGRLEFTYHGTDLLELGSITVKVHLAHAPLERAEDLGFSSSEEGIRRFTEVNIAHNPGLAMTIEREPGPNLLGINFEKNHVIALDTGRGTEDYWAVVTVWSNCTNPVASDDRVREKALWLERLPILRQRIEGRVRSLLDSLEFEFVSAVPRTEPDRLKALQAHAISHPIRNVSEQDRARLSHWRQGRWMLRAGADPLPHGYGSATQTGNAGFVRGDNGNTEFTTTWSRPPVQIAPGAKFEFEVRIENTRQKPLSGQTSKFESWSAEARAAWDDLTGYVGSRRYEIPLAGATKAFSEPSEGTRNARSVYTILVDAPAEGVWRPTRTVKVEFSLSKYGRTQETYEVRYVYDWQWDLAGDNAAIPPSLLPSDAPAVVATPPPSAEQRAREAAERKAKQERIAEIRANLRYLGQSLGREREELARATTNDQRSAYQFRILGLESDLVAEQDLIDSLETGTIVHTRSPFDNYAAAVFQQQCQTEAREASQMHRAVESANRLAALLPPDEAAQAREFIARQFTPKALAEHDAAKARKVVDAIQQKVQGHWEGQGAKADASAAAAQLGFDAATNIKTAADELMGTCALFGGSSVNLIYQAGTGYAEGGLAQAAKNAATTWSDALDYGFTAYDAYQEGGTKGAATTVALKYAQGLAMQYIAGKLMADAGHATGGDTSTPPRRKPTLQEQFDAAKFQQERKWGEALVDDFRRTQGDLLKAGGAGAAPDVILKLQASAREKAAAVASSLHAKNFLKYRADADIGRAYDTHMRATHAEADALLLNRMKAEKWNADEWEIVEFRNSASLGKPNMDRDVGLRERSIWQADASGKLRAVPQVTKEGKPMSLDQWRGAAQQAYNQAYRQASGGRSAEVAMEGVTTSTHPEAYKDLLWLGQDKSVVSQAWAEQAADVTRYKANHLLAKGDPSVSYFTKLQEVSRGTAKDMETKLIPLLAAAKPSTGSGGLRARASLSADALALARGHWAEVHQTLQAFGRNDIDPITATRRVRELTGGKSIPEVVDEMATLLASLVKGTRR